MQVAKSSLEFTQWVIRTRRWPPPSKTCSRGRPWADITLSNAIRADAHGQLLDIPHQHPELKLPADYADMFFLHDTSRRGGDKPKTAKELRAALAVSDSERAALLAAIEEADKREQQEAGREAELEAKRLELEALEKQNAENAARRKQLEAEIAKAKKK